MYGPFAAGYAACFGGALDYVAKPYKKDATRHNVAIDFDVNGGVSADVFDDSKTPKITPTPPII